VRRIVAGLLTTVVTGLLTGLVAGLALVSPASAMTISPSTIDFGPQAVGTGSGPSMVTVYEDYNPGQSVPSMSATVTGDFEVGAVGCARTSCSVAVRFRPVAVGPTTGMLTIVDNFAVTHQVPLSGTGEATVVASASPGTGGTIAIAVVGISGLLAFQIPGARRRRRARRLSAGAGGYVLTAK
jgi:hypothetical protein